MKKSVCFLLSIFCFSLIFCAERKSIENESIKAYRNALTAFDDMDYGKALKYSEDAILFRRQQIDNELEKLKKSLSSKRVHSAGDSISAIVDVLNERNENESAAIINSYLKKKGEAYFDNSMQKLMNYMASAKVFPEAQKIIGDVYKLEGEYQFAEEYYSLALKNADVLDIPDEKYEILYMLADISRLEGDLPKMEIRLMNILAEDKTYKDAALKRSMIGTISANKNDSMTKFFNLYRANSYNCIDAYNQLAEYYHEANRNDKALEFAALAAITSLTRINEILISRNSIYEYENIEGFMQEASYYQDIIEWGNKNSAWKSFNILANYSTEAGYKNFSKALLRVIARYTPETYWQRDAVLQLEHMTD